MKRYIDGDGNFWNGSNVTIGDRTIANPTGEQLIEAGYHEYIAPEPTEEELLERARMEKLMEINEYDNSAEVNSFSIGETSMWLDFEERSRLLASVQAYKAMGRETMAKYFGGQKFEFTVDQWEQMLAALEVYASEALNVTEAHKAAVEALDSIEDIKAFDITQGYPDKLVFT